MGLGVSRGGSIPLPPALLWALGLCATHIVGVIILVVGQLHHPIGALERGTAMGHKLGTIQKTHITKQALGSSANPPHRDHRAGGRCHHEQGGVWSDIKLTAKKSFKCPTEWEGGGRGEISNNFKNIQFNWHHSEQNSEQQRAAVVSGWTCFHSGAFPRLESESKPDTLPTQNPSSHPKPNIHLPDLILQLVLVELHTVLWGESREVWHEPQNCLF